METPGGYWVSPLQIFSVTNLLRYYRLSLSLSLLGYTYSDAAYPHPQPGWSPDIAAKTLCIGLWYEALDHRRGDIFWSCIFSWYHLLNPTPSNIKHIFQSDNDDPTLIWSKINLTSPKIHSLVLPLSWKVCILSSTQSSPSWYIASWIRIQIKLG